MIGFTVFLTEVLSYFNLGNFILNQMCRTAGLGSIINPHSLHHRVENMYN